MIAEPEAAQLAASFVSLVSEQMIIASAAIGSMQMMRQPMRFMGGRRQNGPIR